jgi:hypothetical protein
VEWKKGRGRKEYYAIFAKSFKEKVEEPGLMTLDLQHLKRVFEHR